MSKALLIVEGEHTEIEIFTSLFGILGFTVISETKTGDFSKYTFQNQDNIVYMIPGSKQQVLSIMKDFNCLSMDLARFFQINEPIALNYIVYDVDTLNYHKFLKLLPNFLSPEEGVVLLSNPCIEALADKVYQPHSDAPHEYKAVIHQQLKDFGEISDDQSLLDYIKTNVIELMINQIQRNVDLFNSKTIYEHIIKSYDAIKLNTIKPNKNLYLYSKIFTVAYAMLSDMLKLSRYEADSDLLLERLQTYL